MRWLGLFITIHISMKLECVMSIHGIFQARVLEWGAIVVVISAAIGNGYTDDC